MRLAAAACLAAPAPLAAEPDDSNGVWFTEQGAGPQISGFLASDDARRSRQLPLIDLAAPWTDDARTRFQARLSQASVSKSKGWGYPMMMMSLTPLAFVVGRGQLLILTVYRDLRRVATDGRPLNPPEDRWPTAGGESAYVRAGGLDHLVMDTFSNDRTVEEGGLFAILSPEDEQ